MLRAANLLALSPERPMVQRSKARYIHTFPAQPRMTAHPGQIPYTQLMVKILTAPVGCSTQHNKSFWSETKPSCSLYAVSTWDMRARSIITAQHLAQLQGHRTPQERNSGIAAHCASCALSAPPERLVCASEGQTALQGNVCAQRALTDLPCCDMGLPARIRALWQPDTQQ